MAYAEALNFVNEAVAGLTRAKIEELGTPTLPADSRVAFDAWTRATAESYFSDGHLSQANPQSDDAAQQEIDGLVKIGAVLMMGSNC